MSRCVYCDSRNVEYKMNVTFNRFGEQPVSIKKDKICMGCYNFFNPDHKRTTMLDDNDNMTRETLEQLGFNVGDNDSCIITAKFRRLI